MNIVFMGTPDFAVPSLKAIIENFGVKAVLTQPDRPKGRGKAMAMSPVKEVAVEHNIPVFQPERLRKEPELIEKLKAMDLDFIIVVAYGQLLSQEVLDIPKYGCINLHGSLLPKYRGAAPIHYAIMNGEKITGNTTMLMDIGLDTGDMLLKNEVEIEENMTTAEIYDILKDTGAELLVKTIDGVYKREIEPIKQGETDTCYAGMLNKDMAKINWNQSAQEIHNFVRGLYSFPTAHTTYNDVSMKVIETRLTKEKAKCAPGTIVKVDKNGIVVAANDENILITKVQFPNKKPLPVGEYIKGNSIEEKVVLGV